MAKETVLVLQTRLISAERSDIEDTLNIAFVKIHHDPRQIFVEVKEIEPTVFTVSGNVVMHFNFLIFYKQSMDIEEFNDLAG